MNREITTTQNPELFRRLLGNVRYALGGIGRDSSEAQAEVHKHIRALTPDQLLQIAAEVRRELEPFWNWSGTAATHKSWDDFAAWCERQAVVSNG